MVDCFDKFSDSLQSLFVGFPEVQARVGVKPLNVLFHWLMLPTEAVFYLFTEDISLFV